MEKKKKGKADDRKSVVLANMFKFFQGLGINDSEELISELGKREDEKLNDEEANALRNIFPRKQDSSSSLQAGEESGLDSRVVSAALPENKLNDHQQASSSTKQAKNQRKYLKKKNKKIANQQASESLSTSLGVANVDSNDTEPFISEQESEIPQDSSLETQVANQKASESLSLSGLRTTESIEENRDSISSSVPGFSSTPLGVASVDSNDTEPEQESEIPQDSSLGTGSASGCFKSPQ